MSVTHLTVIPIPTALWDAPPAHPNSRNECKQTLHLESRHRNVAGRDEGQRELSRWMRSLKDSILNE